MGKAKRERNILSEFKYNKPFQLAVVLFVLMLAATIAYVLVPAYYVEVADTTPTSTQHYNGTFDFKGDPVSGDGDEGLGDRISYNLQTDWYKDSMLFILVGSVAGMIIYLGLAGSIYLGKRSQLWPSLFISLGLMPPGLVLMGCFRLIGDHISFGALTGIYDLLGLPWGITILMPAVYIVALLNIFIIALILQLYKLQTRPTTKDIRDKTQRYHYRDMQKLMMMLTIVAFIGIIATPGLPWIQNSQRVTVEGDQEEVTYSYSQHHMSNIESNTGDFLSREEIDYRAMLLRKEENEFAPADNFTSTTRGGGAETIESEDPMNTGGLASPTSEGNLKQIEGPIKRIQGNTSVVSGIERDKAFDDISLRIFQIGMLFWILLLLSMCGLFGINLLRDQKTKETGRYLIILSYGVMLISIAVLVIHMIILYDLSLINQYNQDMGLVNNSYNWWYNFIPAICAVVVVIMSLVLVKRSFPKLRRF